VFEVVACTFAYLLDVFGGSLPSSAWECWRVYVDQVFHGHAVGRNVCSLGIVLASGGSVHFVNVSWGFSSLEHPLVDDISPDWSNLVFSGLEGLHVRRCVELEEQIFSY
jgi:hypothetical protein